MTAKPRKQKLAPDSTRDTEWQADEYRRLMGHEKAAEQIRASRLARNLCVCRRRTMKNHGVLRTVHEPNCTKFKPWMQEWLDMPKRWTTSD